MRGSSAATFRFMLALVSTMVPGCFVPIAGFVLDMIPSFVRQANGQRIVRISYAFLLYVYCMYIRHSLYIFMYQ